LKKIFWLEEEKRERRIDAVEMMGTAAFHQPLASAGCDLAGGVVALGKFDALHVGHRALAERAAEIGIPFLLSFSGMAQVLGWEPRLPVVAGCDRKRVMGLWSHYCRGIVPQEHNLDFAKVRSLSPQQFVEKLATELDVKGVVAGTQNHDHIQNPPSF
jgi:FAD synthase